MKTIINNLGPIIYTGLKKKIKNRRIKDNIQIFQNGYKNGYEKGCDETAENIYIFIKNFLLYDEEDLLTNLEFYLKQLKINIKDKK